MSEGARVVARLPSPPAVFPRLPRRRRREAQAVVNGPNTIDDPFSNGTQGVAAPSNVPTARRGGGSVGVSVLRVQVGDAARDGAGEAMRGRFRGFKEPVFAGERFAFFGSISGQGISASEDTGIWIGNSSTGEAGHALRPTEDSRAVFSHAGHGVIAAQRG